VLDVARRTAADLVGEVGKVQRPDNAADADLDVVIPMRIK
jgi:hypothetical protein